MSRLRNLWVQIVVRVHRYSREDLLRDRAMYERQIVLIDHALREHDAKIAAQGYIA